MTRRIPTRRAQTVTHKRDQITATDLPSAIAQMNERIRDLRSETERGATDASTEVNELRQKLRAGREDGDDIDVELDAGGATSTWKHTLGRKPTRVHVESLDESYGGSVTGHVVIVAAQTTSSVVALKAIGWDADPTLTVRVW